MHAIDTHIPNWASPETDSHGGCRCGDDRNCILLMEGAKIIGRFCREEVRS